jgi:hypothetical protein
MALERTTGLSELAGFGFINLEPALKNLDELTSLIGANSEAVFRGTGGVTAECPAKGSE